MHSHRYLLRLFLLSVSCLLLSVARLSAQTLYVPGGTLGSSSNGNVGIGTTAPGAKLAVQGASAEAWIQSDATHSLALAGWDGTWQYIKSINLGTALTPLQFQASVFTFNSGNVGIGTTSPSQPLEVAGSILANEAGGGALELKGSNANSQPIIYFSRSGGAVWLAGLTSDASASFFINNGYGGGNVMTMTPAGNVGIGTASPGAKLDVQSTNAAGAISLTAITGTNAAYASYNNTGGALLVGRENNVGGIVGAGNYGSFVWSNGAYPLSFFTNATSRMTIDSTGNVGIGTTNPTQKLSVNGTIRAKEVVVDTGWSDYVFDESYKLKALSEVEAYVKTEHHLPGVPSAAQVAKEGIPVGEMQSRLLAKIEELTLHQIEQEKREQQMQAEIVALKSQLNSTSIRP